MAASKHKGFHHLTLASIGAQILPQNRKFCIQSYAFLGVLAGDCWEQKDSNCLHFPGATEKPVQRDQELRQRS